MCFSNVPFTCQRLYIEKSVYAFYCLRIHLKRHPKRPVKSLFWLASPRAKLAQSQWTLNDVSEIFEACISFIMMLADKTRHCPAFLDLAYLILQSRVTAVEKSTCSLLKRTGMLPRKDRFQFQGLRHLYYFIGSQLELSLIHI